MTYVSIVANRSGSDWSWRVPPFRVVNHVTSATCPPGFELSRESFPLFETESRPRSEAGAGFEDSCLEQELYAFTHLLMFHTGPSEVGFSFRPFRVVR